MALRRQATLVDVAVEPVSIHAQEAGEPPGRPLPVDFLVTAEACRDRGLARLSPQAGHERGWHPCRLRRREPFGRQAPGDLAVRASLPHQRHDTRDQLRVVVQVVGYNTVFFTVISVPLSTVVSIAIAMLLNMKVRGLTIYRTIFYLPSVVPLVASSILWLWLFNPSFGLLDSFLRLVGLPAPGWLYSEAAVKPALILMGLWSIGAAIVIYLAGLQGVPQELYEAASLEGANNWQRTWHVTLPMISPVILFNVTLGLIGSFQYFTQAYVMTQGGPNNASLFFALYLYQQAFQYLHLGYGAAMAWLLFVLILLVTLGIFKSSAKWVYYGGAA